MPASKSGLPSPRSDAARREGLNPASRSLARPRKTSAHPGGRVAVRHPSSSQAEVEVGRVAVALVDEASPLDLGYRLLEGLDLLVVESS